MGWSLYLTDLALISLDVNNPKFRKLVGKDAKAETMEKELERVFAYAVLSNVLSVFLISLHKTLTERKRGSTKALMPRTLMLPEAFKR
jgi:hypothetical protein